MCAPCARAAVWANIKDVNVSVLNNGIQVLVKADGVLEFYDKDFRGIPNWQRRTTPRPEMTIGFPNAKNATGKTIIKIDRPPVSYIEFSLPQWAEEGIGVEMRIVFFYPTMAEATRTDDRLGCLVTVASDVTLEERAARATVEITSAQMLEVQASPQTGLLTVVAVKASIHEVLSTIARLTGASILVDDLIRPGDVNGVGAQQITMTLTNATLEEVLYSVAAAAGLSVSDPEESGGVYMFSGGLPEELSAYRLASTQSFPVENIEAATAQGLLPNFLYPHLHVNHDQNAIVVSAPGLMLDKIGRDLDVVDEPSPQIMVDALAVEFLSKDDMERSLGLGYQGNEYAVGTDSATGGITFQTHARLPRDFLARLSAMEREGTVKVWARPRMAVMNGREASIFIGQTRFVEVEIPGFGGTAKQIQGVDVGVRLTVAAWTSGNGSGTGAGGERDASAPAPEITTTLKPVVSNVSEVDPKSGLPVISTRQADTTVRVRDGDTIVIGGLMRQEHFVSRRKIPILGEIPLIGQFFRSKTETSLESELVIFVTPRLLDPATGRPVAGEDPGMYLLDDGGGQRAAGPSAAESAESRADVPETTRRRPRG